MNKSPAPSGVYQGSLTDHKLRRCDGRIDNGVRALCVPPKHISTSNYATELVYLLEQVGETVLTLANLIKGKNRENIWHHKR